MSKTLFWILLSIGFAICLYVIAWVSVRFSSDDDVDLRSLKGKRLTEKQRKKINVLGLSDEDADKITK